jgi:hypothetical protein
MWTARLGVSCTVSPCTWLPVRYSGSRPSVRPFVRPSDRPTVHQLHPFTNQCVYIHWDMLSGNRTRAISTVLASLWPDGRFFGLADFGPYGAGILMTYKCGNMDADRGLFEGHGLCVPQLQWLGLRSCHIQNAIESGLSSRSLLPYSSYDHARADSLCHWLTTMANNIQTTISASSSSSSSSSLLSSSLAASSSASSSSKLGSQKMTESNEEESYSEAYVTIHKWIDEIKWQQSSGKKVELEAVHTLGLDALSNFIQRAALSVDVI